MDNVDYGYKISCGKRKNRTGICTRAADSVDKLWINRKSAHGRHGQRQTGKPRQSGIFPEKTAKIIDLGLTKQGFMNIIEMMFSVIHVVKYCLAGSY